MDKDERESIIVQLAFMQGVNPSVFEKYTDDQLEKAMNSLYGEREV
ncbi:hypothetical protein J1P26_20065 [Neobacillus sp. MM2021_6]|nr:MULTISPECIES: hypothetical protein [Bacillaceae]MBO0962005.1 hypothetical protein [Neobacillus sp. MM2021_6]NHC20300.1 hypothetical protein [Bacillus sp. MM2020_4]